MARTGMATLITELRGLAEAGTADYSVTSTTYWTDDQLQETLDLYRRDVIFEPLQMYPVQVSGGSVSYMDYRSNYGFYEATTGGTAILYLQDSTGANIGTANYTADTRRGQFQFTANQAGSVYYLTGRSYDVQAAAANIWRRKAAHYAPSSFDFSTDNHSIHRSQIYDHCREMADYFDGQSGNAVTSVVMTRSDTW